MVFAFDIARQRLRKWVNKQHTVPEFLVLRLVGMEQTFDCKRVDWLTPLYRFEVHEEE